MYHEINASRYFFGKESDNFVEVQQCPSEVHKILIPAAVSRSDLNRECWRHRGVKSGKLGSFSMSIDAQFSM